MNRQQRQRVGQITAATVLAVGWPLTLLALGYSTLPLAGELATTRCNPASKQLSLWGPIALLSLSLFALAILRVIAGRSPWPFIDHIRTVLLTISLLWVGGLGIMMVYIAAAFPPPILVALFGTLGGSWLASPALMPFAQTLSALIAFRLTAEHWSVKKRIALLAAIVLGLPTIWITATETLATPICQR
jgi:hypothetical protein